MDAYLKNMDYKKSCFYLTYVQINAQNNFILSLMAWSEEVQSEYKDRKIQNSQRMPPENSMGVNDLWDFHFSV